MPKFRELAIGQCFDFVSEDRIMNSFYDTCEKISQRKYRSIDTGLEYSVGSIDCEVFNVSPCQERAVAG
jgi:hypothetical protein